MTAVRAVTPLVPTGRGGVQIVRDADGYDLEQDQRWEQVAGSDFEASALPSSHRGTNGRPMRVARRVASPMNTPAGHTTGRHGRPAGVTSSKESRPAVRPDGS